MYHVPHMCQCPYYVNVPMYNYGSQSGYYTLPNRIEDANGFNSYPTGNGNESIC